MPDSASNHQLNKEFRLHVAAVLYFLSRVTVVVFVFAVPALYFIFGRVEMPVVIGGAIFCAALFVGYYLAASVLRCAACSSPVLMDNGNRKHAHAKRFPGLNQRARVAWDILFSSSYQCMYCVTRCRCKKSWGGRPGKPVRSAASAAPSRAAEQSFPDSIFGSVGEPLQNPELPLSETAMGERPAALAESDPVCPAAPVFGAAQEFPDASTVPVSLVASPRQETVPFSPAPAPPVFPPVPVLSPVFQVSTTAAASLPVSNTSPLPWTIPTPSSDSAMNAPSHEPAPAANPFLAAAAMPPPSPPPPDLPSDNTRPLPPLTPDEFPCARVLPATDGPPPWTIPSMPATPATGPAPVTASNGAAHGPVTPLSAPPRVATSPAPAPAPLLREVISVLEEGQRSLANAFQGLIARLESSLTAAAAPPVPVPAAAAPLPAVPPAPDPGTQAAVARTVPVPAVPPAAPHLPELLTTHRSAPVPVPLPPAPLEKTSFVPLPPVPAPVPVAASARTAPTAPAPAPFPAPPPPAPPLRSSEPAAEPRRRFARPSTMAAQQLNEVLKDAFTQPPAPVPSPGWQNGPAAPAPAPLSQTAPVSPAASAPPATRSQFGPAAPQPAAPSPFGISESPLTAPPGVPQVPAPFSFLKNDGNHFVPAVPGDSLDSEILPWMQPIGANPARN